MLSELDYTAELVLNGKIDSLVEKDNKRIIYIIIKRLFDIIGSFIGILFLIPITIIIKIITMCTGDFHSIFYSQNRIGKNGK